MSTTPYAAPQSHVADIEMREGLEVSWSRAAKVWWSITWRTIVFGMLIGFGMGIVAGLLGVALGTSPMTVQALSSLLEDEEALTGMRAASYVRHAEAFTWEQVLPAYEAVLSTALDSR